MCPPYFRANPQVRPYQNNENYTWDTTLDYRQGRRLSKAREERWASLAPAAPAPAVTGGGKRPRLVCRGHLSVKLNRGRRRSWLTGEINDIIIS